MKNTSLYALYLVAIGAVLLATGACNTTQIKGPKPTTEAYVEPPKPVSTISVPVVVNMNEVTRSLNKQFAGALYTDNSFDDNNTDNLKITVLKKSDIVITAVQNSIQARIPLHIDGVYRIQQRVLGMNVTKEQGLSLNLTALIKAVPQVDANWNLRMNSTTTLQWDDLPVIEFAGLKLDLPQLFGQAIQKQTNQISTIIDREVPKQLQLRNMVSSSLNSIAQPSLIDQATNTWLSLTPKQVMLTPFSGKDSLLRFNIGISSVVEVISGNKPESVTPQLPPVKQVPALDDKIKLMLSTSISFEQINQLLQREVVGKMNRITDKDYDIEILDAQAFPNGNKLYAGIKLNGWFRQGKVTKKIKGIVYVEGTPVYDEAKQQVYIDQFNFDLKTRDVLLKSASWLINLGAFRKKITQSLVFPVGKQLQEARTQATQALNKRYANYLQLSGQVTRIAPAQIIITPQHLRIDIAAEGNIQAALNGF